MSKLQYDDGSPYWLTWDGLYRGTWFDPSDFLPVSPGFYCCSTEYWFYHHSSYPWDTSLFLAELWSGTPAGPLTRADRSPVEASHYTAVYAYYPDTILMGQQFWAIVNTELSGGGWP